MAEAGQPEAGRGAGAEERRSRPGAAALFALVLLSVLWAWWAWQDGAYFPVVILPGTIVLCLGAGLLVAFAPWRLRLSLSPPVVVALVALVALAAWAALSALWSPAPDIAVGDGQRIAVYALAFGLGVGLCNLLGPRMKLSLVPLAFAGLFAGVATIIAVSGGDTPLDFLERDGTLDYPLGYRNANAAFFAIALFPALGLASDRDLDWRLRGLALGTATLCLDLALLSQSRASAPAIVVALVVYTIAAPERVRALGWLALAALPAIATVPALTSLYQAGGDSGERLLGVVDEMHGAMTASALTALAALALGLVAARFERRIPVIGSTGARGNRAVAYGLAVLAVVGAVGFVAAVGNPGQWFSDRYDEFKHAGSPDLSDQSSRFVVNLGSNRYDTWRVALHELGENPVKGVGGGGYQYAYLRERREPTDVRDAHSVEMELLSEFGLVGFLLFAAALVAAFVGVLRARRLGPSAAGLGAIAFASASYWLVHTSVDWFWPYPAITAPTLALLGCACAPAVRVQARNRGRPLVRWLLIAALAALALSTVAPFLSQRYVNDAYAEWRTDLDRAYEDLDRARSLNRLNDLPLLAKGSIANAAGDRQVALGAFREAAEQRPEEWATHYLLAQLQARTDLARARDEIRIALELNPLDATIHELAEQLGLDPETGAVAPNRRAGGLTSRS